MIAAAELSKVRSFEVIRLPAPRQACLSHNCAWSRACCQEGSDSNGGQFTKPGQQKVAITLPFLPKQLVQFSQSLCEVSALVPVHNLILPEFVSAVTHARASAAQLMCAATIYNYLATRIIQPSAQLLQMPLQRPFADSSLVPNQVPHR